MSDTPTLEDRAIRCWARADEWNETDYYNELRDLVRETEARVREGCAQFIEDKAYYYAEDIFTPFTEYEKARAPKGWIDRASAAMGRHCAKAWADAIRASAEKPTDAE